MNFSASKVKEYARITDLFVITAAISYYLLTLFNSITSKNNSVLCMDVQDQGMLL